MEYKTSIIGIFGQRKYIFAVPNYQRAYSWEKDKHISQFLEDLKEHPKTVEQYHLGHFLFETDEVNKNKFWTIDGQQRLTTVVIFMSCVYNKIKDIADYSQIAKNIYTDYLRNSDDEQKFTTVDYDNNFFQNLIIDGISDEMNTRSRKRIHEAFDFFTAEFNKDEVTIDTILHWKDLIENAKITTDTVTDKSEATQLFTFQNDRGKDLTELEKLKSFLMFNVYLNCTLTGKNPNEDIAFIEKEFGTIYQTLELINIADEDQILNYHTIAFFSADDTSLIRVKKVVGKEADTVKWIRKFSVSLKQSFSFVVDIQNLIPKVSLLADILYLDKYNSFPILLKLLHFHKIEQLNRTLKLTEIILFKLVFTVSNYRTNRMHTLALQYQGDLAQLENTLFFHANKGFKEYWNFTGDFERRLEADNHYMPISRYLLWKYENWLRLDPPEPPMSYADFVNLYGSHKLENTLDHWTPKEPDGIEYDQEFKDKFLNNIGNLVLATLSRNSGDNNNMPSERDTVSILIQRQQLEPYKENWSAVEIKNRQNTIVSFAKDYWNPEKA